MKHKLILVDDEVLFREGLLRILGEFGNFEIVAQASNGQELLDLLGADVNFDLILLDLSMPIMDGIETLKRLIEGNSEVKVAILSSHYDPAIIVKLIELGAASFFAKNEKPQELFKGITSIIDNGFHYSPYIIKLLREKMLNGAQQALPGDILSDREKEILRKICEQKTAKEIGNELHISSRTVEGHRNRLLEKTRSKNIVGLIIYAIEYGIFRVNVDDFMTRFSI